MRRPSRRVPLAVALLLTGVFPLAAMPAPAPLLQGFSSMPIDRCIDDGTAIGAWTFVYNGFDCNRFISLDGSITLVERPRASAQPGETHAGLALGPATRGDVTVQAGMATAHQLRTGSGPNAWEVGWLLWRFTDSRHFYYFIPKPNGWELGKADPAYPGGQRFLATGDSPRFALGSRYRVRVVQTVNTIRVYVDDTGITAFTDVESPYTSGRVGLYSEDAESYFDHVSVSGRVTEQQNRYVFGR